jgi:hypothetical protein
VGRLALQPGCPATSLLLSVDGGNPFQDLELDRVDLYAPMEAQDELELVIS